MMISWYLQIAMGNIFGKRASQVTLLSFKQRSTDSSRTSSQRSMLRTSSTRTSFEESSPFPTDISIVTIDGSDVLVVADYRNNLLKTFSPVGNRELVLDGVPYRMAKTARDTVGVTLPLSHEIKIISIKELTVVSTIKTVKMYSGITFVHKCKHKLAVSSLREEPGFVDLIDMTGNTFKTFSLDQFGNFLFMTPSFLSATPSGDILVSDYTMNALTCITQQGKVKWRHQPHKGDNTLEDPVGVVCHDGEHIFLVDRIKKCVFRFTSSGWCFGPVIELNDFEPFSICTDKHKTIFIALDGGNIQVYPDDEISPVKTILELPKRQSIT